MFQVPAMIFRFLTSKHTHDSWMIHGSLQAISRNISVPDDSKWPFYPQTLEVTNNLWKGQQNTQVYINLKNLYWLFNRDSYNGI